MNFLSKQMQKHATLLLLAACALTRFSINDAFAEKQPVVVAFQDAKFELIDPKRPDGPQIAVLWGDPASGPSAMLMKFKKTQGLMHIHSPITISFCFRVA